MALVARSATTISRSILGLVVLIAAVGANAILSRAQSAPSLTNPVPGALIDGSTLLPNGWRLAPAGRHLKTGSLPLNIAVSPDGRYAVTTNNGINKPSFTVVDIATWTVKSTMVVDGAWYGLVWHPDGTKLYAAGASLNNVQEFTFADGTLTRAPSFALPAAS